MIRPCGRQTAGVMRNASSSGRTSTLRRQWAAVVRRLEAAVGGGSSVWFRVGFESVSSRFLDLKGDGDRAVRHEVTLHAFNIAREIPDGIRPAWCTRGAQTCWVQVVTTRYNSLQVVASLGSPRAAWSSNVLGPPGRQRWTAPQGMGPVGRGPISSW